MTVRIRPWLAEDLPAVAALNAAEVPRLGPLDDDELARHAARCDLAVVATTQEGELAGFLLALGAGHDYASVNYRWFAARDAALGAGFLYVDRIAVAPPFRRRGVASALYDAVEEFAREEGSAEVTCEVNVRPPNPGSLAFHASRGFVEVGQQDTAGGAIRVALLAKPLGTEEPFQRAGPFGTEEP
jgi:uncharacterized protein